MKLYIKQKMLSWKDRFTVKDETGNDRYYVEGEMWSFGKKLHVYDMSGREVVYIEQKITAWLGEYYIYRDGVGIAVVRQKFSWFHPKYEIGLLNWTVSGSAWLHEYEISRDGSPVVLISKEWMTWGDSYVLDIAEPEDELAALAVVLVIDCVVAQSSN